MKPAATVFALRAQWMKRRTGLHEPNVLCYTYRDSAIGMGRLQLVGCGAAKCDVDASLNLVG